VSGSPVGGASGLGINDAGDVVGYSWDQSVPPTVCVENATLWTAPNETLVVLGNQDPLDATDRTIANAINNASFRPPSKRDEHEVERPTEPDMLPAYLTGPLPDCCRQLVGTPGDRVVPETCERG
jgi:hypothetical protein